MSLDRFWSTTGDARLRSPRGVTEPPADGSRPRWPVVGELAEKEPLLALPAAPYPATICVEAMIDIPCQIVIGGRQVRWRVLAWNPWLDVFFRLLDAL